MEHEESSPKLDEGKKAQQITPPASRQPPARDTAQRSLVLAGAWDGSVRGALPLAPAGEQPSDLARRAQAHRKLLSVHGPVRFVRIHSEHVQQIKREKKKSTPHHPPSAKPSLWRHFFQEGLADPNTGSCCSTRSRQPAALQKDTSEGRSRRENHPEPAAHPRGGEGKGLAFSRCQGQLSYSIFTLPEPQNSSHSPLHAVVFTLPYSYLCSLALQLLLTQT